MIYKCSDVIGAGLECRISFGPGLPEEQQHHLEGEIVAYAREHPVATGIQGFVTEDVDHGSIIFRLRPTTRYSAMLLKSYIEDGTVERWIKKLVQDTSAQYRIPDNLEIDVSFRHKTEGGEGKLAG